MSIPVLLDPPDPILVELHETRRQLLREHHGLAGLAEFLRQEEERTTRTVAAPPKLTIPPREHSDQEPSVT